MVPHADREQPLRPFLLALHFRRAAPGKAFAADTDAVADRLPLVDNQIKEAMGRIDDQGTRFVGNSWWYRHNLPEVGRLDAPDVDGRDQERAVLHRAVHRHDGGIDGRRGTPAGRAHCGVCSHAAGQGDSQCDGGEDTQGGIEPRDAKQTTRGHGRAPVAGQPAARAHS